MDSLSLGQIAVSYDDDDDDDKTRDTVCKCNEEQGYYSDSSTNTCLYNYASIDGIYHVADGNEQRKSSFMA